MIKSFFQASNSREGNVRIEPGAGAFRAEVVALRSLPNDAQGRKLDPTELFGLVLNHVLIDKLIGKQINNLPQSLKVICSLDGRFAIHVLKTETSQLD